MSRRKRQVQIRELQTGETIHPKREPLTVEKLKTFSGYEDLSEEEVQEKLWAIQRLATLLFEYFKQERESGLNIDNQLINIETKSNAA